MNKYDLKVGDQYTGKDFNGKPFIATITAIIETDHNPIKVSILHGQDKTLARGSCTLRELNDWLDNGERVLINKDMKEVIEVGDIINYDSSEGWNNLLVTKIEGEKVWYKRQNFSSRDSLLKLEDWMHISSVEGKFIKANKQEIIGYETVVDLPGIPKGSKSTYLANGNKTSLYFGQYIIHEKELQDTKFFKPIYKPKEVVVKISKGREVVIDKVVTIKGQGSLTFDDVKKLYEQFTKSTILSSYKTTINSIQVGCQEFTKEDIISVYNALNK